VLSDEAEKIKHQKGICQCTSSLLLSFGNTTVYGELGDDRERCQSLGDAVNNTVDVEQQVGEESRDGS